MAIYLDNSATSWPKPECVYTAVNDYMRHNGASPGRGNYERAMDADHLVYQTRKLLCRLLGAKRPSQIILTCNATEAINMAMKGFLQQGDRVLTTSYEHNAMWRPLKILELDRNIQIALIPSSEDGEMDLQWLDSELQKGDVRLVAVAHGSNIIGCISPLAEIIEIAHKHGVAVLVDAAQTVGAYPLDVTALGVDMLAFTGHKALMGPTGTGGLYLAEGMLLHTFKEGGTGGMSSSPFQPEDPPDRYEAGTMNIAGIAGLYASVDFLLKTGLETVRQHEITLLTLLLDEISGITGVTYHGPKTADKRLGLLSFNLDGQDPHQVAQQLDSEFGIMVRAGLQCAPQAHRLMGTFPEGTVRASVGYFNTEDDIRELANALRRLVERG